MMKIMCRYLLMAGVLWYDTGFALGRLFMTPEQRLHLDGSPSAGVVDEAETVSSQDSSTIRLNGFVIPRHGKQSVWVSGQSQQTVSGRITRELRVPVEVQGGVVQLRPGQTLDLVNHVVSDTYAKKAEVKTADDIDLQPEDSAETGIDSEILQPDPEIEP